jgi:hypothetical protein
MKNICTIVCYVLAGAIAPILLAGTGVVGGELSSLGGGRYFIHNILRAGFPASILSIGSTQIDLWGWFYLLCLNAFIFFLLGLIAVGVSTMLNQPSPFTQSSVVAFLWIALTILTTAESFRASTLLTMITPTILYFLPVLFVVHRYCKN